MLAETDPAKYPRIAENVDKAMAHSRKKCLGEDCDDGAPCRRHGRTAEIVNRWRRMKDRKRNVR